MFEVVVTYRPDFREVVVEKYGTAQEAQVAAERYSMQNREKVVRAWVRQIRIVKTES